MKRKDNGWSYSRSKKLVRSVNDAHKDPKVMSEIRKFVKITTGVYKLKDYRLK